MKHLKNRSQFISEATLAKDHFKEGAKDDVKYEYGCVMLDLEGNEAWDKIVSEIDDDDVYIDEENPNKFGIERERHITALFGLIDSEIDLDKIKEVILNRAPIKLKIINVSMFDNEKFDVLKFGIESEDLLNFNEDLKQFSYKNDFPTYIPHATIGYLKKGTGKKYIKDFSEDEIIELEGLKNITYSRVIDGKKEKIKLELNEQSSEV